MVNSNLKKRNYLALKEFCFGLGVDLFGVADISEAKKEFLISQKTLEKLNRAICLGVGLSRSVLSEIESAPTKLYFHHYRTVNAFLDQAALKLCNYLQRKKYSALPIPASQIVDWQKQCAHLSHRKIGHLAGLGWIGRNNLLVNKDLGSQFRMVTILTDLPLTADKPLKENCGQCRLCVVVCPASAIKEDPTDFNRQSCSEKLKDFQKQRIVDQFICGVCVGVCKGKA